MSSTAVMPVNWQPKLPESVAEIAAVIGREKALYLIGQLPQAGKRKWRVCLYIPKRMPLDHHLVRLLGYADAKKMAYAFSGMILQPSNCKSIYRAYRDREIRRMAKEGTSVGQIASVVDLSPYRIREILAGEPPEGK